MNPSQSAQHFGVTYITRNHWEKNGREREAVGFKHLSGAHLVAVNPRPLVNGPYLRRLGTRGRKTKCEKVLVHVKRFMCSVFPNVTGPKRPQKRVESKRGRIQGFSRKSRSRLIRYMLSLQELPEGFSTLTYDDSVLKALSMDAMKERAHADVHRLRGFVRKRFPDAWSIWRIEWKPRKMGECAGMYAPHIHGLWRIGETNFEQFRAVILMEWLKITGTENPDAWKVTLKRESFVKLEGRRRVIGYVSKYVAKESENLGFDTGRHWGQIGAPPVSKGIVVELDSWESPHLVRLLKKWLKSKGKRTGRYVARTLFKGNTGHFYLDEDYVGQLIALSGEWGEIPF
jgi:hypothetical protein